MNDEGKRDGPRMRWLAEHQVKPLNEAIRQLVKRTRRRGLMPDVCPVSLHYIALGAAGLAFTQAPECAYVTGARGVKRSFALGLAQQ